MSSEFPSYIFDCSYSIFQKKCDLKFSLQSEDAFHEDFEQNITEEDKIYIFAVITRLRRIFKCNSILEEDQLFNKQLGPQIIKEVLSQFLTWKESAYESGTPDALIIQHLVNYNLVKLCFFYWIKDSGMVEQILREIFECNGHFSSMFAHIVNRHDRRSLWRQPLDNSRKVEESATAFFLHHAYKSRLQFKGVRFIDLRLQQPLCVTPAFLAAIYNRPQFLLLLRRYGAKVQLNPTAFPDAWTLPMLLRYLIRILWNFLGEDLEDLDFYGPSKTVIMSNAIHNVAECLRIFLRVIPQIRMGDINFLLKKFSHGVLSGSLCSHEFIRQLSERGIVPKLNNRYFEPSDLVHLCRCVIRKVMNKSWNLPYGISLLLLPKLVKNYIALIED